MFASFQRLVQNGIICLIPISLIGCEDALDKIAKENCTLAPEYSTFMDYQNNLKISEDGNGQTVQNCIDTTVQSNSKLVEVALPNAVNDILKVCGPLIDAYAKEEGINSKSSNEYKKLIEGYRITVKTSMEFSRKYQCWRILEMPKS